MNRRAFISGLLATSALGSWPVVEASTQVNPALAKMAADWHVRYTQLAADAVRQAWENYWFIGGTEGGEGLRKFLVDVPLAHGMSETPWSTSDLKYPPFRVARPAGWRDWYGTEGL